MVNIQLISIYTVIIKLLIKQRLLIIRGISGYIRGKYPNQTLEKLKDKQIISNNNNKKISQNFKLLKHLIHDKDIQILNL